jgi:nucleoside-diphosphate-sugar epimerase
MSSGAKLVVFGANGYVGSTIARIAVASGVSVVAASSSGSKPLRSRFASDADYAWVDKVEWFKVDALKRQDVADFLDFQSDATAIISAIGALTLDFKKASRINGDTNVNIAATVFQRPRLRRFVYISAMPMVPATRVLKGYYHGKQATERALVETLGSRGAILRPGMVNGTRVATRHGIPIPLWIAGSPMEMIFRPLYNITGLSILTPPTHVEQLAKASLYCALAEPTTQTGNTSMLEYHAIKEAAAAWVPLHEKIESGSTASPPRS